jgi:pimeloyl-ACP methyl ester carboxylesterase
MPVRRWSVPVVVAALLVVSPVARGQEKPKVESETINFETADAVQIQGTIYKPLFGKDQIVSAKGADDAPVVMLLHSYMADPNAKEWDGLAIKLAEKGFHVLRFDFRGHGKSTVINKQFWGFAENSTPLSKMAKKKPLPQALEKADIKGEAYYFPVLVNDIMAARVALDKMNDAGKLNTATVYLIGAGDAATLGMMYMATEWTRPQKPTEFEAKLIRSLPLVNPDPRSSAGKDIAGAVWLSPARPASVSEKAMKSWVEAFTDLRESNPVLCLHGDGDTAGRKVGEFIVNEMLVAKPGPTARLNKLPFTKVMPIEKSKLTGAELLKAPGTEDAILKYLETLEKDRKNVTKVVNRNWNDSPFIHPTELGATVK